MLCPSVLLTKHAPPLLELLLVDLAARKALYKDIQGSLAMGSLRRAVMAWRAKPT